MLAPGLRLGWISAVRPIVDQLAMIKQQCDPHTQNLSQLVICELLEQGVFDRHLVTLRTEHRRRRDAMVQALRQHVPANAAPLRRARRRDVSVVPARRRRFAGAAVQEHALRESVMVLTGEPVLRRSGRRRSAAHLLHVAPVGQRRSGRADAGAQPPRGGERRAASRRLRCAWSETSDTILRMRVVNRTADHDHRRPAVHRLDARRPTPTSTRARSPCRAPRPTARRSCCPSSSSRKTSRNGSKRTPRGCSSSSCRPGPRTKTAWPATRDLATFREWFRVDIHSVVVDVADDDIEGEEL